MEEGSIARWQHRRPRCRLGLRLILADALIADGEGVHPAYTAQQKAIQSARLLAVELGLSIVSRARSFQGKSADERDWGELEVG
jgi:hypothetical protein